MQDITVTSSLLVSGTAFNLQLSVTSQTLLSSCSLPSAFLSNAASEREIWFSRGQGFCLSFRVLFDGERVRANDPKYGNLVECFARALRDAEVTLADLFAWFFINTVTQPALDATSPSSISKPSIT
jgi:hypothetical protein